MIIIEVSPNFGFRDKGWKNRTRVVKYRPEPEKWSEAKTSHEKKNEFMSENEFGYCLYAVKIKLFPADQLWHNIDNWVVIIV